MSAGTATDEERAELWPRIVKSYAGYGDYQRRTDRQIPVVIVEPRWSDTLARNGVPGARAANFHR